jgi:hypothetical protein
VKDESAHKSFSPPEMNNFTDDQLQILAFAFLTETPVKTIITLFGSTLAIPFSPISTRPTKQSTPLNDPSNDSNAQTAKPRTVLQLAQVEIKSISTPSQRSLISLHLSLERLVKKLERVSLCLTSPVRSGNLSFRTRPRKRKKRNFWKKTLI